MNYLSNKMDESLWVNLKVIANLQPFQRINTRPRLFQISQSNSHIHNHTPTNHNRNKSQGNNHNHNHTWTLNFDPQIKDTEIQ